MDEQLGKKLEDFFTKYKHQKYKKGEILVRADDDPSGIFYITKGVVKMYLITSKGDEIVLNIFKPISFFPMSWGLNVTPNKYYFEATEEVEVWRAPREAVLEFLQKNPDIVLNLLSRVYKGIDGMFTRMVYLMAGNAHARLLTELIISAKRFGQKQENNAVTLTISEKDLGTQTGLTRETISREIKVLKEKGLVKLEKNILTITSISELEADLLNS